MDRRALVHAEVCAHLRVRRLASDLQDHTTRPPALLLQILREGGELADLQELGLRDERAPPLRVFQPALHDQLGDRLAKGRAGGAEPFGQVAFRRYRNSGIQAGDELQDLVLHLVVPRHLDHDTALRPGP
jgi:hypothetical protein